MATTKVAAKNAETNGIAPPEIEVVDVTPALARGWLQRNKLNRNLRERKVQQYCTDMRAGDWRWTGESVKFDTDGNLIDGQHRLTALILSDRTVKMLVVRGLEAEAQEELDQGIPRRFHDVLQLRGDAQTITLAAIVRRVTLWETGQRRTLSGTEAVSTPQQLRTLETYPELRDIAVDAKQLAQKCELPGSLIGLAIWVFSRLKDDGKDDCKFFFERLADGQNMQKGDPIYELRRTIAGTKDVRGQRSQQYLMAITIKAWNAFRQGRSATDNPVGLYRWRRGGANPEPFPEPV